MGIAKRNWPLYSNDISLVTCIYPYMQLLITFYMKFYMFLYICNISVSDQTKFSQYHTNTHCIYISNIDVAKAFYNIIYQKWNDVQLFVLRVQNSYFYFYFIQFTSTALSQHWHRFLLLNHLENILQSLLRHLMLIAKQQFILCYSNSFNLRSPFSKSAIFGIPLNITWM